MSELERWLENMMNWHQTRKHDQEPSLECLLLATPHTLWLDAVSDEQSEAMALWLDGYLRIFKRCHDSQPIKAYQFLQLASAQLQQLASSNQYELVVKDWAMKRLQLLVVMSLEFCNQRPEDHWQTESKQLIEAHVRFSQSLAWNESRNNDQGAWIVH